MQRHQTPVKDTQLFDWEAEPALERSSSFFYPDEMTATVIARARGRRERRQRRGIALLLGIVAALGVGVALMIELAPALQRYLGAA